MKWAFVPLCLLSLASPAGAENCTKSREYILEGLAGTLVAPAENYQNLFKICLETLTLANVKDAYLLRDGGLAVVPKNNSLVATAETLSQFCQRFPRSTARFVTPREQKKRFTTGLIVTMSSGGATSCKKIRGLT
jgi:hypothetical protein